jgi:hypothetical protein
MLLYLDKFELWKDVAGDVKPAFELQVLMETNLPLLPAEKQPSAAVKLQLLKDDIKEAKIAQFSAIWAEVTEASKLRTLSRYGLDYRTAEDANDVSALMKLLAKVHLGQSQSNTDLVIDHEDRLLKPRPNLQLTLPLLKLRSCPTTSSLHVTETPYVTIL